MNDERRTAEITLRTFVTARWVFLGLVAFGWAIQRASADAFAWITSWLPPPPEPGGTAAVMVTLALLNLATQRWILRGGRATTNLAGLQLVIDATALTVLLALSGGLINSFTTMYFVPITLATQVSPRWTWALATYCLVMFASLFALAPDGGHSHAAHDFGAHLRGMWVAFAVSGALMTYFVHRIAISLARQRTELARLRDERTQDRHLAAMGTLAAGAAHELGSPLGTIGMLAADLEVMDTSERHEAVTTIRHEIARCKHILHQMASPELRLPTLGRARALWRLSELPGELEGTAGEIPVRVAMSEAFREPEARSDQPLEVLGQILRELVSNAAEACRRRPGSSGVQIQFDRDRERLRVEVRDDGAGMDAEQAAAAFDPFFSTRAEGEGMGLGLYLARAHLRQLGGAIELSSRPGEGTRVLVSLPLRASLEEAPRPASG
ncbi:MAG: HAMP domain-containing histidine kinase [Myxococcales bacterium]|nr:HAMP domain-containing histidine kinase [Myxococcales bacterium]